MKSNITRVSEYEIYEWLKNTLEFTPYQESKFTSETVRCSPFYFYKVRQKQPVSLLWRITLVAFPIYWLTAFLTLPIMFIFTGKWGFGRGFIDKFHNPWVNKLGF